MTDQPPARRLSDKIRAAWNHALEMGRDEIADRLSLIYEATVAMEIEKFPRRRHSTEDAVAFKLSAAGKPHVSTDDDDTSSEDDDYTSSETGKHSKGRE